MIACLSDESVLCRFRCMVSKQEEELDNATKEQLVAQRAILSFLDRLSAFEA